MASRLMATGILGVRRDVRSFIEVSSREVRALAERLRRRTPIETARSVYRFNVRNVKYPLTADGSPAAGFEVKAYPWLSIGLFKLYLATYSQPYAWLLPSQVLKLGYGLCADTSNLCTTLLRVLGLEAYTVLGVVEAGDGIYGHAWTVVKPGGRWLLMETTIHRGRPPLIPLEEASERLGIDYLEIARFDEKRLWVDERLMDRYRVQMARLLGKVEL